MRRRLEDRIRELCGKVVSAPDDEIGPIIEELKVALREHSRRLSQLAAQVFGGNKPNQRPRR